MAQETKMDVEEQVTLFREIRKSTEKDVDFIEDDVCTDGARNGPGFVYLLSEHTWSNGQPTHYYKIGVSSTPRKRIADLQTGNPRPLVFQGEPVRVSKVISAERRVHRAVGSYASSLGGGKEWFHVPHQDWESFWNSYQKALSEYVEDTTEGCTHTCACTCTCTCTRRPSATST